MKGNEACALLRSAVEPHLCTCLHESNSEKTFSKYFLIYVKYIIMLVNLFQGHENMMEWNLT
jgi:hypothetical protein